MIETERAGTGRTAATEEVVKIGKTRMTSLSKRKSTKNVLTSVTTKSKTTRQKVARSSTLKNSHVSRSNLRMFRMRSSVPRFSNTSSLTLKRSKLMIKILKRNNRRIKCRKHPNLLLFPSILRKRLPRLITCCIS